MKNLKNNIEQTCIDFGRYVSARRYDAFCTKNVDELWDEFQKMHAKEVMDILDACDSPQEPNDKVQKQLFDIQVKHSKSIQGLLDVISVLQEKTVSMVKIMDLGDKGQRNLASQLQLLTNAVSANGIALNNVERNLYRVNAILFEEERSGFPNDLESNDKQPDVKENLTTDYSKTMTAEEFYKDHFGHTSQHVSMDKIFVCMELYAIHKRETPHETFKRYNKEMEDQNNSKPTDQYEDKTRVGGLSPSEKMARNIKWCEEILLKPKHTTRTGGLGETGPRN